MLGRSRMQVLKITALIMSGFLITACSQTPKKPGISEAVCWNQLEGWKQDQHSEAIPAIQAQCKRMSKKSVSWKDACSAINDHIVKDDLAAKTFFETYFVPHNIIGKKGINSGLITGYYEPTLYGSYQADERFHYPLYKQPDDMLIVKLDDRFPQLKGKRVRGRIKGNQVIPYYERSEIDDPERAPLSGQEILWVDDSDSAFFLHIQGSGRVQLPDGSMVGVGYANQNGHPYVAIGKKLIERGELTREEVSLQTIRHWLKQNPDKAHALKNENPSYVFFRVRNDLENGPRGSLNVPLTQERSAAVDRKIIPLGTPLWVSTHLPNSGESYQRIVVAQDTGGAIVGPVRADLFFGRGDRAERLAGEMKQSGSIYALLPKQDSTLTTTHCN